MVYTLAIGGIPPGNVARLRPNQQRHRPSKIRARTTGRNMAAINQDDFIRSVADALQYISFYHPVDYITNLARAYEMEQGHAAKDAIAQILINSRMCAEGHRPICQDTGI